VENERGATALNLVADANLAVDGVGHRMLSSRDTRVLRSPFGRNTAAS
jgi:hypothetical protein